MQSWMSNRKPRHIVREWYSTPAPARRPSSWWSARQCASPGRICAKDFTAPPRKSWIAA